MSALWDGRKVIVAAGTGGVGKTTVAAAIGVAAAAAGKRTLVMTIDPARRLANALGISDFGNIEREIKAEQLVPYGVTLKAPLWAMMPDVKTTFDDLVTRIAPSDERRERIMKNRFYKQYSTVIAGSLEYAAVEKLYELYRSNKYDLIVLDTPPSQNAVDFLNAPNRIINFLEQDTIQKLLSPYAAAGRLSLKIFDLTSAFILRTLGRFAGGEVIRELAEFLTNFGGLYDGFRERSGEVRRLLRSDELAFLLVTTARGPEQAAMLRFRDDLQNEGLLVRALVLNRVRNKTHAAEEEPAIRDAMTHVVGRATDEVMNALREERLLAELDARAHTHLTGALAGTRVIALPELPLDAHDLASLAALQRHF